MEHDRRACLRCGKPAGDRRFCESCHSQFDSFRASLTRAGSRDSDAVSSAAREVRREKGVATGDGDGDEPRLSERLTIEVRERVLEPGLSTTADERPDRGDQPPRELARFEAVLTPIKVDVELEAYRRADAAGDPQGATNLGVLLEQEGDLEGALAAYRRADGRGDVNGSFNLGCLLAEMGDLPGAQAALQRADQRGDAAAATNLGVLLEQEGEPDGALAAYRRADERGDALGAFNLGLLLTGGGDLAGARAAYRRAANRGDAEMRDRAAQAAAEIAPSPVDPTPPAQAQVATGERVVRLWIAQTSRNRLVASLCVVALLGLVAVQMGRGLRRLR